MRRTSNNNNNNNNSSNNRGHIHMDMPLFSPTQVPVREAVLNSIFAPLPVTAPALITAGVTMEQPKTPTPRKQRQHQQQERSSSNRAVVTTPGGDEFYSPMATPASLYSASSSSSNHSFRSYKNSIPVEMLSFEYVSSCQSEQELHQIVSTLHADNKAPSLLRKARSQLDHAIMLTASSSSSSAGRSENRHNDNNNSRVVAAAAAVSATKSVRWARNHTSFSPPSFGYTVEDEEEDDSLVMSLSTTMLDEYLDISSPWANNSNAAGNRNKHHQGKITHQTQQQQHQQRSLNDSSDRTLFLQEELQKVEEERSVLEQQLGRQVKTLEERLEEARESNIYKQLSLVEKIEDLETARWDAKEKVVHLQHAMTNSSAKAHNMVQTMEAVKLQSDTLRKELALKEQQYHKTEQKAQQNEEHLRNQVTTLASQLRDTKENGASAAKEQELTQQLQHRAAVEASMQKSLQSARKHLTSIQTEQEDVLASLQHALGRDVALVPTLEASERRSLAQEVTRKLAASKAAVKAFAQAMREAEKERHGTKEAYRNAILKVQELKRLSEKLARENSLLVQQNGNLSEELDQTKAYVNSMVQQSQDTAQFQIREQEYKHTIALLKKQIRSGESVVSMSLYQQAVKEGKASQQKVKAQTTHIAALESNLVSKHKVKVQTAALKSNLTSKTTPMKYQESPTSVMAERQFRSESYYRVPTPPPHGKPEKAILAGRKLIANRHPTPPISRPPSVVIATPSPQSSYMLTASPRLSSSPRPRAFAPPKQFGAKRMDPPESTPPPPPPILPVKPSPVPTKVSPCGLTLSRRGFGSVTAAPKAVALAENISGPPPGKQQLRVETKEVSPPPPPPPPSATKRAYNRFHALQAAGGSKAIREKFNQARRSPLSNATNTVRATSGAIF